MVLTELCVAIVTGLARSTAGWLENSLQDKKIDSYELAQLGATIVRVGVITIATFYGLNGIGVNIDAIGSAASTLVLDYILSAIKKAGTKK